MEAIFSCESLNLLGIQTGVGGRGWGLGFYATENRTIKSNNLIKYEATAHTYDITQIGKVKPDATSTHYSKILSPFDPEYEKQWRQEKRLKEIEEQVKNDKKWESQ